MRLFKISPFKSAHACLLACLVLSACSGGEEVNSNDIAKAGANSEAPQVATNKPVANHDEEIARLERQAERNPTDDTVREALAVAYVRRGDSLRASNDLKAALKDYRRAIVYDEDNEDAQKKISELSLQVEGEKTGEYGEPAPPPISPGVTTEDDDTPASPTPTPTPRKRP